MEDYFNNNQNNDNVIIQNDGTAVIKEDHSFSMTTKIYAKVFGLFGLSLLIAAGISLLLGTIYVNLILNEETVDAFLISYIVITVIGAVGLMVTSFLVARNTMKESNVAGWVCYALYSVFMGLLLGGVTVFVGDSFVLGASLLITAILFFAMCGLGVLLGDKIKPFVLVIAFIAVGGLILSLVNIFLMPILLGQGYWEEVYILWWVLEAIIIIVFAGYIVIDMNRIKHLAESGSIVNNNVILYLALMLATDFINLFLRILRIVLVIVGSAKKN